jgi:hypothetical protein
MGSKSSQLRRWWQVGHWDRLEGMTWRVAAARIAWVAR